MEQFIALALAHQWIPLMTLTVGGLVRVVKQDTKLPINIPARYRPLLALALSVVGALLQKLASGIPWQEVLTGALVSAFTAIAGHDVIIEGVRGGKEIKLPGLMRMGNAAAFILCIGLATLLSSCTGSFEAAAGPRLYVGSSPALAARCESLDTKHRRASATAKTGAILAGAAGLSTIPIDNDVARIGLPVTAVAAAAAAGGAMIVANKSAEGWARECSGR